MWGIYLSRKRLWFDLLKRNGLYVGRELVVTDVVSVAEPELAESSIAPTPQVSTREESTRMELTSAYLRHLFI